MPTGVAECFRPLMDGEKFIARRAGELNPAELARYLKSAGLPENTPVGEGAIFVMVVAPVPEDDE